MKLYDRVQNHIVVLGDGGTRKVLPIRKGPYGMAKTILGDFPQFFPNGVPRSLLVRFHQQLGEQERLTDLDVRLWLWKQPELSRTGKPMGFIPAS